MDVDGTDVRKLAGQLNLEKKQSRFFHSNKLKSLNILYKISFYNYIINITQSDKIIVYFCYYIVYLL